MSIQQLMLGVGASKKTYLDEVFSTYLWKGNGSTSTVNNGIDLSGEGGLTWIKQRQSGGNDSHFIYDTVRGATKRVLTDHDMAEGTTSGGLTQFNNNGFNLGGTHNSSSGSETYASYSFRKAPGFFDIVTYTGNGTAGRTVSHNLKCIPGCILIKRLDASASWKVYHRSTGAEKALALDTNAAAVDSDNYWNDTEPTASVFTLKQNTHLNANGGNYVAYLFAGGESTAATARSIELDGSNDYFQTSPSTDFEFTGDFTFECWFKTDTVSGKRGIFNLGISNQEGGFEVYTNGTDIGVDNKDGQKFRTEAYLSVGQWYHIAFVRSGSAISLYLNGTYFNGYTDSSDYGINSGGNRSYFMMGTGYAGSVEHYFDGHISNVRVLNGTALYTSSFRPPTEPLTNITNTKLLCCNNSSVTGSTVAPTTLTASGTVASADHPFDDPAGFVFGDKENIIKCNSYIGNGLSAGPTINLGYEPQWILIKRTDSTEDWMIFDNIRGMINGGNDPDLRANVTNSEYTGEDWVEISPTGFQIKSSYAHVNDQNNTYIYMAIRRADGYVGKPVDAGTDVFAIDTGNSSSTIPTFDSGFPVDFAMVRAPASSGSWETTTRLMGTKYMTTNTSGAESSGGVVFTWDSNVGWLSHSSYGSSQQSWMWKRHAGLDVVTYTGNGTAGHTIPHSLSKNPEMMWLKRRNSSRGWFVYHKSLDGGNNPETHYLLLDSTAAEGDEDTTLNDTAPTSTHFTLGASATTNGNNDTYLAMLFASCPGVSAVGSYTGTGSSGNTITLGFQPRFVIIKNASTASTSWVVLDTTRGWGSGSDKSLELNDTQAQETHNYGAPTSTGFTIDETGSWTNTSGDVYVYYAHA